MGQPRRFYVSLEKSVERRTILLGLAPLVEVVISQSFVLPKTKAMSRWAKWISHCGVISATSCLRNDWLSGWLGSA